MLRSDHSAFLSPRVSTPPRTLLIMAALAALAVAAGCSPKIGDNCSVSTDCSATGDRLCDITEPGGYCTVFNCEPDSCPDSAACVNFGSTLSSVVDPNDPSKPIDPACTLGQGNSPYQRSFCLANCESDSDCRGGYRCIDPAAVDGVEVDMTRSSHVCAVPRTGSVPTLTVYGDGTKNDEVCLGSDAGSAPDAGNGGASGSDNDAGTAAGQSSGGASGADNAGAGG